MLLLIKKAKPVDYVEEVSALRNRMVDEQLAARDISDESVLSAMRKVPRHLFLPDALQTSAYLDRPLPIGHDQTISQPYMVALMTQILAAGIQPGGRILEIGSGCGYQTAILVSMGYQVHCIEIIPELLESSRERLSSLKLEPSSMQVGDGHLGLESHAPYDGILAAACARKLPKAWRTQLTEGGVIVAPVKRPSGQHLFSWKKTGRVLKRKHVCAVRFVPLVKK